MMMVLFICRTKLLSFMHFCVDKECLFWISRIFILSLEFQKMQPKLRLKAVCDSFFTEFPNHNNVTLMSV